MMGAMISFETSVLTRATRRIIIEDGILHSQRRENLRENLKSFNRKQLQIIQILWETFPIACQWRLALRSLSKTNGVSSDRGTTRRVGSICWPSVPPHLTLRDSCHLKTMYQSLGCWNSFESFNVECKRKPEVGESHFGAHGKNWNMR
jgi:hypothetical protein